MENVDNQIHFFLKEMTFGGSPHIWKIRDVIRIAYAQNEQRIKHFIFDIVHHAKCRNSEKEIKTPITVRITQQLPQIPTNLG